jgi:D-lactate dehydrogenase (cytochrome)
MREDSLGLECVLPDADATVVRVGIHAWKSSAGHDPVSLMCGSKDTYLGCHYIGDVTGKLHPIPEHAVAAVCVFDSLTDTAQAVAAIKLAEIPITRCELLDARSVHAFNAYSSSSKDDDTSTIAAQQQKEQ